MAKGGVSAREKMCRCAASTSISPVASFGLGWPPEETRETTLPATPMQNSLRRFPASSWASLSTSGPKTTWVMPSRSRRSMKMRPPWSRRFWTQPISTTWRPRSEARRALFPWVRLRSTRKVGFDMAAQCTCGTRRRQAGLTGPRGSDTTTTMRKGFALWFTGLSGAGKSTLSMPVARALRERGLRVEVLDGDEVRTHLSKGLGYTKEDRDVNVRRIGFVAGLLARNGVAAITAAISPYRSVREEVRRAVERDGAGFVEVYVKCPLEVLARRDV